MKKIILTLLFIFGFTINVFALIDVDIDVNDQGIVKIKGESSYERERISIKVYDDFRKYYINQDKTDKYGNFEFEFKVEEEKEYDGEINIKGRKEEFSFSTEDSIGKVEIYIKGYRGVILSKTEVEIKEGDTALDVTKRILDEKNIKYDIESSGYVKSIDGQAEYEKGAKSGWMFCVNNEFPEVGAESVELNDGDYIKWLYTTNLGQDIGKVELIFENPENDVEELINEVCVVLNNSESTEREIIQSLNDVIDSIDDKFKKIKKENVKDLVCYVDETSKLLEKACDEISIDKNSEEIIEISSRLLRFLENSLYKIDSKGTKGDLKEITLKIIDIVLNVIDEIESINEIQEESKYILEYIFSIVNEFEDKDEVNNKLIKLIEKVIEKTGYVKLSEDLVEEIENKVVVQINMQELDKTIDNVIKKQKEITKKLIENNIELGRSLEKKIVVEVPIKEDKNQIEIKVISEQILNILSRGIDKIEIKNEIATFNIGANTFSKRSKEEIKLNIKRVKDEEISEKIKLEIPSDSIVVALNIKVEGKKILDNPIEVSIPYKKDVKNPNKVTVFYLKNDEYIQSIDGHYDQETKTVKFILKEGGKYFAKESAKKFNDLENIEWAKDSIEIMAGKGIINGKDNNNFRPNDNITRAEYTALITRLLKYEKSNNKLPFKDVSPYDWYYKSVQIAYQNKIINGKTETIFDPNGDITRQEMAKIIFNILKEKGYKKGDYNNLNKFKDKKDIAPWAKESVGLLVKEGIITGMDNETFEPNKNATRAQAAVILYRLYNLLLS